MREAEPVRPGLGFLGWSVLLPLVAITAIVNALLLTSSIYAMQVFDRVLTSRSEATLFALTLLAVGMISLNGVLEVCRTFVLVSLSRRYDQRSGGVVFNTLMSTSQTGDMQGSQAFRDLETVRNFWFGSGIIAALDLAFVPAFLLFLYVLHPAYGILGLVALAIVISAAVLQAVFSTKGLTRASAENVKAHSFLDVALRNADATEAMGMREPVFQRWVIHHGAAMSLQEKASRVAGLFSASVKSAQTMLAGVIALAIGAVLAIEQIITPGTLVVAGFVMVRALTPGLQVVSLWQQGISAHAARKRLQAFLQKAPAQKAAMQLPPPLGALSVEDLQVSAPGSDTLILKGVNFSLEAGETLAVVGPSAAGKTTLARAILGVISPTAGTVRLDGADISQMPREQIGPYVGYLPQSVELFAGTVAENIARLGEIDAKAVVRASQLAGVNDMILKLPNGYDTVLGPGGQGLSPGQRQRIGLARALYGEPRLIVLDEPESNLDSEGQEALQRCIRSLGTAGITTVVVSHRMGLISEVDSILMLQAGRVVKFAKRDEFLRQMNGGAKVLNAVSANG